MLSVILKKYRMVILCGLGGALLFGGLSLLLPKQYSAESKVYVMADGRASTLVTAPVQSIKFLSKSLVYLITSPDFAKKVIDSPDASFDPEPWNGLDERSRRNLWHRNVHPCLIRGTGLIRLKVYSGDKADALAFSRAITQTLAQRGFEYTGNEVTVKVVSEPLVSRWPARPHYVWNIIFGFLAGILASVAWIIRRHSKRHFFFR